MVRWCWIALVIITSGLITACGTEPSAAAPEEVHAQWVEAVRTNNREQALAAAAPQEFQSAFVDQALTRMQQILQTGTNGIVPLGDLERVEIQPLTDAGMGKMGISAWHFAERTICYQTDLTVTDGRWGVLTWGTISQCPTGST